MGGLVARGEDLTQLPGIGKDLAGKIHEMLETRHLAALDTRPMPADPRLEALFRVFSARAAAELRTVPAAGRLAA